SSEPTLKRPPLRYARTLIFATLASASAIAAAESPKSNSETPLFDYANEQPTVSPPENFFVRKQIAKFESEMSRHPPPADSECAHTLGAVRFASQYDSLGAAQSNSGNYDAAIEAYEKALACAPRAAEIHAELATELLHVGRLADARKTAARGIALTDNTSPFDSVLMQLDFIEEHWAEAVSRLRAMATAETDAERAT